MNYIERLIHSKAPNLFQNKKQFYRPLFKCCMGMKNMNQFSDQELSDYSECKIQCIKPWKLVSEGKVKCFRSLNFMALF